jgi:L-fuconolactonase
LASSITCFAKFRAWLQKPTGIPGQPEEFDPYMDVVVERLRNMIEIMFGSDWPVCKVAATYEEVYGIVKNYFSGYSESEKAKIFGENAIKFYSLSE